jgi:predicted ATPase with chaperone activity
MDVAGQLRPRKALEYATIGGHHLLFIGPPGTGKTITSFVSNSEYSENYET